MALIYNSISCGNLERHVNRVESQLHEETSYYHLVKADALRLKNYFWDSIEEYLTAIELDDTNIEAFKGLGLSYKQIGCTKSAITAFKKAKNMNPFDKYYYYEIGCCYCVDQKFSKAIPEFRKALKICPDYLEAQYNLALAYEMSRQYELAVEEYKKLIDRHPEFINGYNNLGGLYMKMDIYSEAAKVFRSILKLNSNYIRAYLGVAISLDKTGEKARALRYYKKYLDMQPESENVPYVVERICEIQKDKPVPAKKAHLMLVS